MHEKLGELQPIDHYTWVKMSALVDEAGPGTVKDKCLHISMWLRDLSRRVLDIAMPYPWNFLHGDRTKNLEEFAQ
eukprot:8819015-Lingulodinium_polyedra.AAC.1